MAWTRHWAIDAAYRQVQSLAGNVRDPIQGYRGSEALTIAYIDPIPQHVEESIIKCGCVEDRAFGL